ncbi:class I histocompatibility antigen, F10 alpha chain-like isoform X1 [Rana temporaria]|uniref:class I histocompatibility antigen, F10 alpha chain-like isoform X1 n=1 Tax=Rana temporaria TaxID=8407 RepID=UPI001AACBD35|nr:class I histocompatibility antigen, F10 alpha chain-like isoform X1 [Rana temporaria]
MVSCCGDSPYRSPQRMEMTPLILIILGVSGGYCDSHSMRYYHTTVSSPGSGLPVYSEVGYVDDKEIANYNSDTRQYLPKTEWMKKLGSDYWEGQTQTGRRNEAASKYNVQTAMRRFNQTGGIHIVQVMKGCKLRDDGTTEGYYHHRYDGREFMSLDTENGIFIPTMNEAQITTQRWNSPEERWGEIQKNYVENICIEWLKKYINNGREDLEKRVRPEVKVWGHRQSDDVARLECLVYGFHPQLLEVKWVRNGEDDVSSYEKTPILPHPDGTYQIRVSVEVPTREGDTYSCHVEHSSLGNETLRVKWDPSTSDNTPIIIGVVVVGAVLIIGAVIGFLIYRRRSGNTPGGRIINASARKFEPIGVSSQSESLLDTLHVETPLHPPENSNTSQITGTCSVTTINEENASNVSSN